MIVTFVNNFLALSGFFLLYVENISFMTSCARAVNLFFWNPSSPQKKKKKTWYDSVHSLNTSFRFFILVYGKINLFWSCGIATIARLHEFNDVYHTTENSWAVNHLNQPWNLDLSFMGISQGYTKSLFRTYWYEEPNWKQAEIYRKVLQIFASFSFLCPSI